MSFSEVAGLDADVTVALGKTNKETGKPYPKSAEGYFLGSRTVKNKRGDSQLHFLQTDKGNLGVWGTTDLNRKLSQVTAGTMIRITSTGTKPTPNGDMYTYKVEQDKTNTIEVAVEAPSERDGELATHYGPVIEDEENDEDDSDSDQDYQSAAMQAKRKADVEALLKPRSKKN